MASLRRVLRDHAFMLIGVIGGLPIAIAYFIYLPWAPTWHPHARMTLGRCAAWVQALHPADCAFIDQHPTVVLVGPGRPVIGSSGLRRVPADADRKVDVALSVGWYDVGFQLPDHRILRTSILGSELIMLWVDQGHGTVTPDTRWRLDRRRD
jgi:hypothetical protein